MPVTVGIFISSGNVPTASNGPMRINRSFEYDSLGNNYASFLLDEFLPHVVRTDKLNLSTEGNDRCIAGLSSGGLCAFNAAWERPDAFWSGSDDLRCSPRCVHPGKKLCLAINEAVFGESDGGPYGLRVANDTSNSAEEPTGIRTAVGNGISAE